MFAVALGYDVFKGGLDQFSAQAAYEIKERINELTTPQAKQKEAFRSILNFNTRTKMNFDTLLCYTNAILYDITCDGYMYNVYVPNI